jgi:peroxiredoxin
MKRLQPELKDSVDRKGSAKKAIDLLEDFIAKYPAEPVADKAKLSLGNMQLLAGDAPAAIATFQRVVDRPLDATMAPAALFYLGKTQAAAGQLVQAEATFNKLKAASKEPRYTTVAQAALGMLAVRPGKRPPTFLMRDLEGKSQSPDLYRGKVLLLDFWATWCSPCRAETANLKRLYRRYHKRGLHIVGISLDTNPGAVLKFIAEENIRWPQLWDGRGPKGELARQMGVMAIPKMILIDRKGIIREVSSGGSSLDEAVRKLMDAPATG